MKSSVVVRSLLSLILLPSITVGCGGTSPTASVSQPPPVTQPPLPSSPPPLPSHWEATDLPPITGAGAAQANALNNSNHVVGYSVENGEAHATLWENGIAQDLGANTFANAINDSDEIAGYRLDDSFFAHAHLWPEDIDLGAIAGFDSSVATGINASGLVVGVAFNQSDPNHQTAFTWTMVDGMKALSSCASAEAVNKSGQISGSAANLDAAICGGQDFGMQGTAVAINNLGQTAGFEGSNAFLFANTNLGPTLATGINDNGWVIGAQIVPAGNSRVQRLVVSHVARLNPRVTGTSQPWIWSQSTGIVNLPFLVEANSINQSGAIAGAWVTSDNSTHAALLTAK